ncbi:MAG: DNA polymerase domain-containing protein [Candidatus Woesearchaeota archaeon]
MKINFYPLDFQYKVIDGKVLVYVYSKLEDGQKVCIAIEHQPYFYAKKENVPFLDERLKEINIKIGNQDGKITSYEEVEKEFLGYKETVFKIYTNVPRAVPVISKELESWGLQTYEKDILFVQRFVRDTGILPLSLAEADGEFIKNNNLRVPFFKAEKIISFKQGTFEKLKILSIDIETYAKKKGVNPEQNPILMIAFSGIDEENKIFQKLITWKKFPHNLDYLEVVNDEEQLLKRFREIMLSYNPDIITGYFTDGFDFPYIKTRADKFKVKLDLGIDFSELEIGYNGKEAKISGILHLDVFKFVRNIFGKNLKTDSYSLDEVAHELLGHRKHPVNISQLYQAWDHDHEKLEEYSKYNMHDADLTLKLCQKLLLEMIEFAQICGLPLFDVIRMSFSRLVESYIMKRAIEFNVLSPNRPSSSQINQRMDETYEGAFVYEPSPGLYKDLVIFDFRSLYPSIITSHNIGPESLHCQCCKDDKKTHVPGLEEYWFCNKDQKFTPILLGDLVQKRADLKKAIKKVKDKDKDDKSISILEAKSYALKILANSFYGYLGYFGARWYCFECARSTTAYARNYIKDTIEKAEVAEFKVCYGDSLTPERKIFIMDPKGEIHLSPIGEFVDTHLINKDFKNYKTFSFDGNKLIFSNIKKVIRHHYDSKEKGDLLNIITTHGTTTVTPQHSIYTFSNGKINLVDASTLNEGDFLVSLTNVPKSETYFENHTFDLASLSFGEMDKEIYFYKDNLQFPNVRGICPYCKKEYLLATHIFNMHNDRKIIKKDIIPLEFKWVGAKNAKVGRIPRYWKLTTELAWVLGYYCADGSVSDIRTKAGSRKCLVSFGSQDKDLIKKVKSYFDNVLGASLKIIVDFDKRINKEMYYYRVQRIPLVGLLECGFGCGKSSIGKKVPSFIFSSEEKIRRSFIEGYLAGDGNRKKDKRYKTHFTMCDTNSKELACGLQYLFKSFCHGKNYYGQEIKHVGWKYRKDKPNISSLRVQTAKVEVHNNFCTARIKEIKRRNYQGNVYDLEVDGNHNFVDAEGLLLVHNTDSLFLLLGEKTIEDALTFLESINSKLHGQMELEYEGYYPKGIFVALKGGDKSKKSVGAKKKYALKGEDGKLKITGFEIVRRNWSEISKEVQETVLNLVLDEKSEEAVEYVKGIVTKLKAGKIEKAKLIIKTKITRELESYSSIGPHVKVAKEMVERGDPVSPGTIVEYIIVKGPDLIRDKARLLEDVSEGEYDAEYYLNNQIIPAVSSIFAVLGYTEEDIFSDDKQKGLGDFFG